MKKIRISYSLINMWERGDPDRAVQMYFHLDTPITRQMEEGREIHEDIAKHVEETGQFPEWFFNYELTNPKPEEKLIVNYNEAFDLSCVIDLLDEPLIYEYKTGVTDSLGWTRTDQLPFYFLVCELAGKKVDSAFLIRYNQYIKKTDYAVVHNHRGLRERAREIIDSVGPEIREFFLQEGLL